MATKVPLVMLKSKVITQIAASGPGLLVAYSDGTTSSVGSVGGSSGSSGAASVFTPRASTGAKAGDIAVEGGIIYMHDGSAWRQIYPAVYS